MDQQKPSSMLAKSQKQVGKFIINSIEHDDVEKPKQQQQSHQKPTPPQQVGKHVINSIGDDEDVVPSQPTTTTPPLQITHGKHIINTIDDDDDVQSPILSDPAPEKIGCCTSMALCVEDICAQMTNALCAIAGRGSGENSNVWFSIELISAAGLRRLRWIWFFAVMASYLVVILTSSHQYDCFNFCNLNQDGEKCSLFGVERPAGCIDFNQTLWQSSSGLQNAGGHIFRQHKRVVYWEPDVSTIDNETLAVLSTATFEFRNKTNQTVATYPVSYFVRNSFVTMVLPDTLELPESADSVAIKLKQPLPATRNRAVTTPTKDGAPAQPSLTWINISPDYVIAEIVIRYVCLGFNVLGLVVFILSHVARDQKQIRFDEFAAPAFFKDYMFSIVLQVIVIIFCDPFVAARWVLPGSGFFVYWSDHFCSLLMASFALFTITYVMFTLSDVGDENYKCLRVRAILYGIFFAGWYIALDSVAFVYNHSVSDLLFGIAEAGGSDHVRSQEVSGALRAVGWTFFAVGIFWILLMTVLFFRRKFRVFWDKKSACYQGKARLRLLVLRVVATLVQILALIYFVVALPIQVSFKDNVAIQGSKALADVVCATALTNLALWFFTVRAYPPGIAPANPFIHQMKNYYTKTAPPMQMLMGGSDDDDGDEDYSLRESMNPDDQNNTSDDTDSDADGTKHHPDQIHQQESHCNDLSIRDDGLPPLKVSNVDISAGSFSASTAPYLSNAPSPQKHSMSHSMSMPTPIGASAVNNVSSLSTSMAAQSKNMSSLATSLSTNSKQQHSQKQNDNEENPNAPDFVPKFLRPAVPKKSDNDNDASATPATRSPSASDNDDDDQREQSEKQKKSATSTEDPSSIVALPSPNDMLRPNGAAVKSREESPQQQSTTTATEDNASFRSDSISIDDIPVICAFPNQFKAETVAQATSSHLQHLQPRHETAEAKELVRKASELRRRAERRQNRQKQNEVRDAEGRLLALTSKPLFKASVGTVKLAAQQWTPQNFQFLKENSASGYYFTTEREKIEFDHRHAMVPNNRTFFCWQTCNRMLSMSEQVYYDAPEDVELLIEDSELNCCQDSCSKIAMAILGDEADAELDAEYMKEDKARSMDHPASPQPSTTDFASATAANDESSESGGIKITIDSGEPKPKKQKTEQQQAGKFVINSIDSDSEPEPDDLAEAAISGKVSPDFAAASVGTAKNIDGAYKIYKHHSQYFQDNRVLNVEQYGYTLLKVMRVNNMQVVIALFAPEDAVGPGRTSQHGRWAPDTSSPHVGKTGCDLPEHGTAPAPVLRGHREIPSIDENENEITIHAEHPHPYHAAQQQMTERQQSSSFFPGGTPPSTNLTPQLSATATGAAAAAASSGNFSLNSNNQPATHNRDKNNSRDAITSGDGTTLKIKTSKVISPRQNNNSNFVPASPDLGASIAQFAQSMMPNDDSGSGSPGSPAITGHRRRGTGSNVPDYAWLDSLARRFADERDSTTTPHHGSEEQQNFLDAARLTPSRGHHQQQQSSSFDDSQQNSNVMMDSTRLDSLTSQGMRNNSSSAKHDSNDQSSSALPLSGFAPNVTSQQKPPLAPHKQQQQQQTKTKPIIVNTIVDSDDEGAGAGEEDPLDGLPPPPDHFRRIAHIIVAVRGSINVRNHITNIDFGRAVFREMVGQAIGEPLVHQGLKINWETMKRPIFESLDKYLTSLQHRKFPVVFTGHSSGGAMAVLGAYSFTKEFPTHPVSAYVYGMPRIGNTVFRDTYDAAVPDTYRVTVENDIASELELCNRVHVGIEVVLDRDGNFIVEANGPEHFYKPLLGGGFGLGNHRLVRYARAMETIFASTVKLPYKTFLLAPPMNKQETQERNEREQQRLFQMQQSGSAFSNTFGSWSSALRHQKSASTSVFGSVQQSVVVVVVESPPLVLNDNDVNDDSDPNELDDTNRNVDPFHEVEKTIERPPPLMFALPSSQQRKLQREQREQQQQEEQEKQEQQQQQQQQQQKENAAAIADDDADDEVEMKEKQQHTASNSPTNDEENVSPSVAAAAAALRAAVQTATTQEDGAEDLDKTKQDQQEETARGPSPPNQQEVAAPTNSSPPAKNDDDGDDDIAAPVVVVPPPPSAQEQQDDKNVNDDDNGEQEDATNATAANGDNNDNNSQQPQGKLSKRQRQRQRRLAKQQQAAENDDGDENN